MDRLKIKNNELKKVYNQKIMKLKVSIFKKFWRLIWVFNQEFDYIHKIKSDSNLIKEFVMKSEYFKDQVCINIIRFGWHGYEPPIPMIIVKLINHKKSIFIDIGANTGYYSLLAYSANAIHVYSFEPMPYIYNILEKNIDLNKAKEKIETFDIAVGQVKGSSLLYSPREGALIETSASLDKNFKENSTGIVVNVDTLDNVLFDKINVGLEVIIKIDVENCEHMVLEGMFKILDKLSPTIILEILENSKNKEIIYKILESNNLVELNIDGLDTSGDKKNYKNNNKLFVHAEKIEIYKRILVFK